MALGSTPLSAGFDAEAILLIYASRYFFSPLVRRYLMRLLKRQIVTQALRLLSLYRRNSGKKIARASSERHRRINLDGDP